MQQSHRLGKYSRPFQSAIINSRTINRTWIINTKCHQVKEVMQKFQQVQGEKKTQSILKIKTTVYFDKTKKNLTKET